MKKTALFFSLILVLTIPMYAQHIREQDIVYSKTIVREIDLRFANNKAVFGKESMLSRILLDGIKDGAIAYCFDNRTKQISYEQIKEKLKFHSSEDSCSYFYDIHSLYVVELTEKFIFDKNTSEFRFIPIELTVFIPAKISSKAIMEPLAVIPFEECTRIFRKDPRAYSVASRFGQPSINFNEQFLLRAYVSNIVKIGNENALYFDQQHVDPYKAFMAMKQEEQAIQEMMYAAYHPE